MIFGEKVKEARLLKNLSQTELAAITGISERSLYTYEQLNTLPRKNNIKKLAGALSVSISYLIDDEEADKQKNIENEDFLDTVKDKFGYKGAKEAKDVLDRAGALFAGGELDDDAKEIFMQSLMQVYISSKKEASEKFSRKKKTKPPIDESVLWYRFLLHNLSRKIIFKAFITSEILKNKKLYICQLMVKKLLNTSIENPVFNKVKLCPYSH